MVPSPRLDEFCFIFHPQAHPLHPAQSGQRFSDFLQNAALADRNAAVLVWAQQGIGAAGGVVLYGIEKVGIISVRGLWYRGHGRDVVVNAFGDTDTDAVRGFAEEVPEKGEVASGDRGGDVGGGVAQVDGEDFGVRGRGEEGRAEGEDGTAVGGGAFGEDDDGSVGVFLEEGFEIEEFGVGGGVGLGMGEGLEEGLE